VVSIAAAYVHLYADVAKQAHSPSLSVVQSTVWSFCMIEFCIQCHSYITPDSLEFLYDRILHTVPFLYNTGKET